MSDNGILGDPGEDNLGLVIDFANKLKSGNILRSEAKLFLQRKNPWPEGIIHAVSFDPIAFLGESWSIEEQDERSLALTEVDLSKVTLETCLKGGEASIQGEERLVRLKAAGYIRLDARFFMALWKNKKLIPDDWKGKIIYFDGTVLRSPNGDRCVLCLCWNGDQWYWSYGWLGRQRNADRPSVVLASSTLVLEPKP